MRGQAAAAAAGRTLKTISAKNVRKTKPETEAEAEAEAEAATAN